MHSTNNNSRQTNYLLFFASTFSACSFVLAGHIVIIDDTSSMRYTPRLVSIHDTTTGQVVSCRVEPSGIMLYIDQLQPSQNNTGYVDWRALNRAEVFDPCLRRPVGPYQSL